jgi:hypothetical protein
VVGGVLAFFIHPLTTSCSLEYLIWKTIWTGQYHI